MKIFRFGVVTRKGELAASGCASVPPFLPATPTKTRTSMPTKHTRTRWLSNIKAHQVSSPSLTTLKDGIKCMPIGTDLALGLIVSLSLPSHRAAKKSNGMDKWDLFHAWQSGMSCHCNIYGSSLTDVRSQATSTDVFLCSLVGYSQLACLDFSRYSLQAGDDLFFRKGSYPIGFFCNKCSHSL